MARFELLPCKIRKDHLVPVKGAVPLALEWDALRTRLAPAGGQDMIKLQGLRPGAYVGLVQRSKTYGTTPATWVLINHDRSGNIQWILKKDPTFQNRILEAYRVDSVLWDSTVLEPHNPGK